MTLALANCQDGVGKKAELIKPAQTMINDANLSPWSINELAAALSTLEIRHGSASRSKKLLLNMRKSWLRKYHPALNLF